MKGTYVVTIGCRGGRVSRGHYKDESQVSGLEIQEEVGTYYKVNIEQSCWE